MDPAIDEDLLANWKSFGAVARRRWVREPPVAEQTTFVIEWDCIEVEPSARARCERRLITALGKLLDEPVAEEGVSP